MNDSAGRIDRLRDMMAQQKLDALLITGAANRRYLSGFTGSAGSLLITADSAHLITDGRYYDQVRRQAPNIVLEEAGYQTLEKLGEVLAARGAHKVGFEAEVVTVDQLKKYREKLPEQDWFATTGQVGQLRTIKSDDEIAAIARAAALTDRAMRHAYEIARPGMLERELAWKIEVFMREAGADGLAFETIVAAGENGALPHHHPGDRPIEAGEPIVIDMGARLDGYCSDLTRTFSIGPAHDPDYPAVWEIVAEANRKAVAALRPGPTGPELDSVARDHIQAAGYGEAFGHSLGHGVGLEVHEGPRLSQLAGEAALEAGMIVTIEPGIYLPGRFGVRIEDLAVIRDDGAELLSSIEKQACLEPMAV